MPSFSTQVANLRQAGPTCKIRIMPSNATMEQLRKENKPIPHIDVTALIDTGASGTAVSKKVVDGLQLVPRGVTSIATPSSDSHQANIYDISLHFPNRVMFPIVQAIEASLTTQNIDCLIGRDVLQHVVLTYTGFTNTFTLSF